MKFNIRSKITSGYVSLIICLIVAVSIISTQISSLQAERNNLITNNSQVQTLISSLEKNMLNMNRSQRGYLITGKTNYLDPYHEAVTTWEDNWNELYTLMKKHPDQQQRLRTVSHHINTWIEIAGEPSISLKRNNDSVGIKKFYSEEVGQSEVQSTLKTLKEIRDNEATYLKAEAQRLDSVNNKIFYTLGAFLFISGLVAMFFSRFISKSITRAITRTTAAIRHTTNEKGALKTRIPVTSNDEIRDLTIATNKLLDSIESREWLQENTAETVKSYQGITSIQELASLFLTQVANVTKSTYGALYIQPDNEVDVYERFASYALTENTVARRSFKLGEGLIGQCAKEGRMMRLENLDDYQLISTGLGDIAPKDVLIIPITFEGQTIAVLEIASVDAYRSLDMKFLSEVVDTLGLTINSVLTRMKVVRLLNESRTMSEELQAQSEELQTQSEELQAQTEELTNINEQLEERTREAEEKTAELEITKADLERNAEELIQSSKYKSEFLANMSHELRTPLNSILILSEMLGDNMNGVLGDEEVEFAKVINSSGKDLLSLINDVLDLSKVEAGKLEMLFEEVNIDELPLYLTQSFSHFGTKNNVEFNVYKDDDVGDIFYTDQKRFQQILKNLLSNAFKFTDEGEVSVHITTPTVTDKQLSLSDNWIQIAVKDTGIGIPKEKHDMIFESFQQADGATVRKYGGTGLGLSICKEFAALLGGTITLQSEEGKGSTFTLTLPSLPTGKPSTFEKPKAPKQKEKPDADMTTLAIEAEPPALLMKQDERFKNKRVLIVDDDERNIFALEKTLTQQGMIVNSVKNGVECLTYMQGHDDIDIILMDIMMPELDGYDTMKILREEMNVTLPIIALTAKAMKSDREKCIAAGASDYISKPLNLEQLFSVLRVWLATEVI
ncbi:ATP-binding protein [Kurthia massiliensis]|uniref:ATP-binding protein n=1 Tax=Kurthia massiliensis TaxID=1033739 RepID=UPI000289FC6E|nr:ATP-binding protein [Kurthia massiliensis]